MQLSWPGLRPIFGTLIISLRSSFIGAKAERAREIPIYKICHSHIARELVSIVKSLPMCDLCDAPSNQLPTTLHSGPFELEQFC